MGCAERPGHRGHRLGLQFERGANIVSSQQYSTDSSGGRFFLRTEFFLSDVADRSPALPPQAATDEQIQSADTRVQAGGARASADRIREGGRRAV
jgi:formyltetrahydrofolate hydrolase